jgi:arylformamidase
MSVEASGAQTAAPPVAPTDPVVEARRAQQRSLTDAVRSAFRHELGVPFGAHPRQVLDVYYPQAPTTGAPVLVFLHGGGFRAGDPSFNGYHGRPYLEAGSIFVAMGYRLAPEMRFPDTCEDVEQGLAWLHAHIAQRGGDPGRIYLSGHSAGAILAAHVGLRALPASLQLPPELVRGLVLISGMYDTSRRPRDTTNTASPRYVPNLSNAIERLPEHTVLVAGDNDLPACLPDAQALYAALTQRGASAELFVEPNADHFAANRSFVSSAGNVAQAVKRMMRL